MEPIRHAHNHDTVHTDTVQHSDAPFAHSTSGGVHARAPECANSHVRVREGLRQLQSRTCAGVRVSAWD